MIHLVPRRGRRTWAGALAERMLSPALRTHLADVEVADAGSGYDAFGAHPEWVRFAAGLMRPLHEQWFRVTAHGAEHLPKSGPTILAANHSGSLPFDAMMLWADVLQNTSPPRVARAVLDHFVPGLPFVGTLFIRAGSVGGSRGNVRRLLEAGELLLVFPEGTAGIGKPYWQRYELQAWHVGHAELALRHRAAVVPTAVIGAEEQLPQVGRVHRGAKLFGAPYLPVILTPLPLPVHYHIHYGAPINLHDRYDPEDSDDPEVLRAAANDVKCAVEDLIREGLATRPGVFR
jgi:1-acyl-sn-glycerol-3-phosphate acyltransferase